MSKTNKSKILKHLADREEEEKKDLMPHGEYFDWYSDNYLVHTINEKSYMTQYFVDTETSYVEMAITVIFFDLVEKL